MSRARYIVGDVRKVLAALPEQSVDLVMTSPPFLALRSYLPPDHPDKPLEIGSEPTPGAFIDTLLDVVEACAPLLAPHGSMCFELGDTYSGSGGAGGDYNEGGLRDGQERFDGSKSRAYGTGSAPRPARSPRPKYQRNPAAGGPARDRDADEQAGIIPTRTHSRRDRDGWPLDKSLCLIPEIFRFSLVYGFNPLTGRETPRWRARNVIRWCRPNPPVGALGDKVRPATSDMVVVCADRTRYFDLDAVRHQPKHGFTSSRAARTPAAVPGQPARKTNPAGPDGQRLEANPAGAPPLDHWWIDDVFAQDAWHIPTQPYEGSHYATWPEELCVTPIKAMCPLKVCTVCGRPSERITERVNATGNAWVRNRSMAARKDGPVRSGQQPKAAITQTLGWTDCGCQGGGQRWRNGVVLDPFAGSGTTLAVATGHGRDAIGIDLDTRNADLALHRVGPLMLTIESGEGVA